MRAVVVALLLLAVSPVTAPFSTYDLQDLFGGTPHGVAVVHTKAAADDSIASIAGAPELHVVRRATPDALRAIGRYPRRGRLLHLPLRI